MSGVGGSQTSSHPPCKRKSVKSQINSQVSCDNDSHNNSRAPMYVRTAAGPDGKCHRVLHAGTRTKKKTSTCTDNRQMAVAWKLAHPLTTQLQPHRQKAIRFGPQRAGRSIRGGGTLRQTITRNSWSTAKRLPPLSIRTCIPHGLGSMACPPPYSPLPLTNRRNAAVFSEPAGSRH